MSAMKTCKKTMQNIQISNFCILNEEKGYSNFVAIFFSTYLN